MTLSSKSNTLAVMPVYMKGESDLEMTKSAISSFRETCDADLLVVDDGSPYREGVHELIKFSEPQRLNLMAFDENQGFAKAANRGLRVARKKGQHGLLVNADVEFMNNGWLDAMRKNEADVVGALLLYPNGLVQHAGVFFSLINRRFDHIYRLAPRTLHQVSEPRICPVTGALMLIKNKTLDTVGVLDENFKMGFEDVDYCHMVFQMGLKCAYEPEAQAVHYEGIFRADPNKEQKKRWDDGWAYLHEKHKGHGFADYVPTLLWEDES